MTKICKWGIFFTVLAGCGGGGSSSPAVVTPPTIAIVNECPDTVVGRSASFTQAQLTAYIPVLQAHMADIAAAWGARYNARVVQRAPQAGDIVLTFYPGMSPQGPAAQSFHTWDGSVASASVYVGSELASGNDPLLAAAHEISEVVIDPQINGTEIVDPVVCFTYCQFAPIIPGMLECGQNGSVNTGDIVPDFVLPSWNGGAFPYDHMELLTKSKEQC